MAFIEVGALVNGKRPATKKALRDALTQDPTQVTFDGVSPFKPFAGRVTDLPAGDKLQVTGPDPFRTRNWYATVTIVGGNVKVS